MSVSIVFTCTKGPDILSKKPFVKLAVSCFFSITIVIVFVFIVIIVIFIKIIIVINLVAPPLLFAQLDNLCIDHRLFVMIIFQHPQNREI